MESQLSLKMVLFLFVIFYVAVPYNLDWTVVMTPFPDETARLVGSAVENTGRQVGITLLALVSLVMIGTDRVKKLSLPGWLGPAVVLFLLWALLSFVWSDAQMMTFKRLVIFSSLWLAAFALARRYSYADIALLAMCNSILTLILSLGVELFQGTFHPLSQDYRFSGVMHPNAQGLNCALLFISSWCFLLMNGKLSRPARSLVLCCTLLALLFLVLTRSRTALLSSLTGIGFALLCYQAVKGRPLGLRWGWGIVPLQLVMVAFLWDNELLGKLPSVLMLGRETEVATLTGRTDMWRELLSYVAQSPLLGYGYDSFWTVARTSHIMASQGSWVASDHSSYFNTVLGLGVIGLALFLAILALSLHRSIRLFLKSRENDYLFTTALLVMTVINMLMETVLFQFTPTTFVMLTVIAKLSCQSWTNFRREPSALAP